MNDKEKDSNRQYLPEPFCKIEVMDWLINNLSGYERSFKFSNLVKEWGWSEANIKGFLNSMSKKGSIHLKNNGDEEIVIAFSKSMEIALEKIRQQEVDHD